MTPEPIDPARTFLDALHARGVTVSLRNNRITLTPGSAYKTLTDDEYVTLRKHRSAIKDLIVAGPSVMAVPTPTPAPEAASVPSPPPLCSYCRRAPCLGPNNDLFSIFHYRDPLEVAKRDEYATQIMMRMIGRGHPNY